MQALMAAPFPNFYESRRYVPIQNRVLHRTPATLNTEFSRDKPNIRSEMLSYFEIATFERVGVLSGEYALLADAECLISRDGTCLKANVACEDRWANTTLDATLRSERFFAIKDQLINNWDRLPLFENVAILSDVNTPNYYHLSLEMVPRLRFFKSPYDRFIIPQSYLAHRYLCDLLGRTMGRHIMLPQALAVRVRDPLLAHDSMSDEGIHWLRDNTGLRFGRGDRRIYIRRSGGARGGGGISEDLRFRQFIKDHQFEIVEFGNGEHTVGEQVRALDGAGIIIAAHGAGLTNIVYAGSPISLIEVLGFQAMRPMYSYISSILNFQYYGALSMEYDEAGDIIVDPHELQQVLARMSG